MAVSSTSGSLISGAIKWTGLASGTDFASVVESLVSVEERVITKQESWKADWQAKLGAITTLDTRLGALKQGAASYDERTELLSRKATSSDEKVATITNTSTAPTGVYSVEVAAKVQEKIASGSFRENTGIGINHKVDKDGNPVDINGDYVVDHSSPSKVGLDADGNPVDAAGEIIFSTNPADFYYPPLTISMGGKTLTLDYGTDFTENTTLEDLVDTINAKIAVPLYDGPNIKVDIAFDKNRTDSGSTVAYNRLVITGLDAGKANHITVSDPTNLRLDRTSIDTPVTNSLVGSNIQPRVSDDAAYTGLTNKTITFVCTNITGNGILGSDDVEFSWADTEGKSGKFVIKAADWDQVGNCLKEDVEILQGVKINFDGAASGSTRMVKNEAFTIDCQSPVLQKAADSGLAQTDKWVHNGFADLTSPVTKGNDGKFVFSYAGKEYSINIRDGLGLSGLAEAINSSQDNPGVIASVLNDGMGTATSYKLVLTGAHAGAENGIRISDKTNLSVLDCSPKKFEHAREASNSMCRIDGYPNDGESWIQRRSNEVGDVLDGIAINLEGSGETQIVIQNDVTDMKNKIKQIVEAVNYAKTYIKEQTKWGEGKLTSEWDPQTQRFVRKNSGGTSETGIMIGNYGFQIAQSTIDRLMTKQIFTMSEYITAIDPYHERQALYPKRKVDETTPGQSQEQLYEDFLERNGLLYTRLSDIGIISDPDLQGQYVIEESKLTEALSKNPEAVIKLFTFVPPNEENMSQIRPMADEEPRPRIGGFNIMMGYAMSDLTRTNDVIDPRTGNVITPAKGITKVLADNYQGIIKDIDDKINRETVRIQMVRNRLEEKFSRLETLLASLNDQSSNIAAQIAQLDNSNKK